MSAFTDALEAGDLAALRRISKADLHIHGIGGGDRAFLRERTGVDIVPVEGVLHSMAEMHAFSDKHLSAPFEGPAGRALALEATFVQARKDGVTRIEVGTDAWEITLHSGSAESVWNNLRDAREAGAPGIQWIPQLGISRHCTIRAIERWMAPFLELGVFESLDLSGDEEAQPIENFVPVYRRAKGGRAEAHGACR